MATTFTNRDVAMLFATKNIDEVFQDVLKFHKESNKKQKGPKKQKECTSPLPNTYVLSKNKGKYKLTYGDLTSIYDQDGIPTAKHEIKCVKGIFFNKPMGKIIVEGKEMTPFG